MASPSLKQNKVAAEPSLSDVLMLLKKDIMLSLNCHSIGTIQSFDATSQSATVTINYTKTFFQATNKGAYDPVQESYPILIDCPVVVMHGSGAALTFPISTGDYCLVLFNDRDIDNWISSGQSGRPVATQRYHAVTDAIALVGINPFSDPLEDYDTERAVLYNGETKIGVGEDLILITNAQGNSLNNLLQELVTDVKNLVTQVAAITVICAAPTNPSSIPVNAATITAISTQLTATAVKIGELLE